jgi:hypothetical protein
VDIQRREVSLLPRPTKLYSEVVDASERLIASLVEIRILRFSVPRKATVLDVLPLRRELVSLQSILPAILSANKTTGIGYTHQPMGS